MKKFSSFLAGVFATTLVIGLSISALAVTNALTITVDPTVKIQVNGAEFHPKDANGKDVMTFAYGGTTYAPVRAMAEAFGLEVGYDAQANMATVGEKATPKPAVSPEQTNTSKPTVTPKPTPKPPSVAQLRAEENDRHNAAIEELESQYDSYEQITNDKISEIRSATTPYSGSDSSYESEKRALLSDLSRLQSKINSLQFDDSREAQVLLRTAESEMVEKQQELDELQEAYSAKSQIEALKEALSDSKRRNSAAISEENQLHRDNLSDIGY